MHFEFLVEDLSGSKMLNILVPKIIDFSSNKNTLKIHTYSGIGKIPKNEKVVNQIRNRMLLNNLPKMLKSYGKCFQGFNGIVVIVCDLDKRCQKDFRNELLALLENCDPKPRALFCFAIEEMEAWLLGDFNAIKRAYPNIKVKIINHYKNDDICNTWELLADAIYKGGSQALLKKSYKEIGTEKSKWAENISSKMDIENNLSPSFCYFRDKLRSLTDNP
ncbi:MAG: DUF4276 family protein [Ignavibacteria bacterium]|nr:DUF4276 family protein [Ignavibacteria bacterium]